MHGAGRDADNYYRSSLAAGFLAGALDDTVIIVPRIASNNGGACRDALAPNEVSWICEGTDSWRYGGPAIGNDKIASYDVLDEILRLYVEENLSARDIIAHGFDEKTVRWVQRRVDLNEYKREQAAPGLRVTTRAFGVGRRMPIAQQYVD